MLRRYLFVAYSICACVLLSVRLMISPPHLFIFNPVLGIVVNNIRRHWMCIERGLLEGDLLRVAVRRMTVRTELFTSWSKLFVTLGKFWTPITVAPCVQFHNMLVFMASFLFHATSPSYIKAWSISLSPPYCIRSSPSKIGVRYRPLPDHVSSSVPERVPLRASLTLNISNILVLIWRIAVRWARGPGGNSSLHTLLGFKAP